MQAQIAIHQDYPRISPLFALTINWKHERSFLNDEAIKVKFSDNSLQVTFQSNFSKDMEREINLFKDNFLVQGEKEMNKNFKRSFSWHSKQTIEEKNYDIFAKQVNHLMICFDVYLESEAFYLNDSEFHRSKLFPNCVR